MIWQLFGTHIIFVSTVLTTLIAWLFWPRQKKRTRSFLIRTSGLVALTGLLLALFTYWPRTYEKQYLETAISSEIIITPLKALADSIGFYIGVATSSESEYKSLIAQEFNSVVGENDFKPGQLLTNAEEWAFDFSKADKLSAFAASHNMRLRGHTLIWGKFAGMTYPKYWNKQIKEAVDPKKEMTAIMTRYINTVMRRYKGKVSSWDVVNEPMDGINLFPSPFTEALGEEYIDLAFNLARVADPDCELFLNEQINDYYGRDGQAFLALLRRLLRRNVPIDGVGLQTHNVKGLHNLEALTRYLRDIGDMGLKVEITELDVRLLLLKDTKDPYAAQGLQYGGVTQICLEDPACVGVTLWGLTDGSNWMDSVPPFKWKSPNAPNIYDEDMRMKPAYVEIWKALERGE